MNTYLLFKSVHLIAVISWMAGLLYLPRIFVYHVEKENSKEISETFKIMERRLMIYIMNHAMILSWFFGLMLIMSHGPGILSVTWIQLKLILVYVLIFLWLLSWPID